MYTYSLKSKAPFINSLTKHFHDIPYKNLRRITNLACRYACKLVKDGKFNKEIGSYSIDVRNKIRDWKREIKRSYYFSDLWRALVTGNRTIYKVEREDLVFVKSHLSSSDRDRLIRPNYPVDRLTAEEEIKFFKEVKDYCGKICWRKLRFITNHNSDVSQADFISELEEVAIKSLRLYENEGDYLKVLNYTKRAIHNTAINIISRYTSDKRSRLKATPTTDREYTNFGISYDDNMKTYGIDYRISKNKIDITNLIHSRLGPDYEHYALAVLGRWPDFDDWVKNWHGVEANNMSKTALNKLALNWVGLTQIDLERKLAPFLIDMNESQEILL